MTSYSLYGQFRGKVFTPSESWPRYLMYPCLNGDLQTGNMLFFCHVIYCVGIEEFHLHFVHDRNRVELLFHCSSVVLSKTLHRDDGENCEKIE